MNDQDEDIRESIKNLEKKLELLDKKIIFLFSKVNTLADELHTFTSSSEPAKDFQPIGQPIEDLQPIEQPKEEIKEYSAVTEPSATVSKPEPPIEPSKEQILVDQSRVDSTSSLKKSTSALFSRSREELFPYFLLLGFYLLLFVTVYAGTLFLIDWLRQIGRVTQLNVFLYITIFSCLFIIGSLLTKSFITRRSLSTYLIFPWSFLGLGTAGIFISYIVSTTVVTENPRPFLIWFLAITGAIISLLVAIYFKNEFLIGEAYLCLNLISLIPIITNPEAFGEQVGYIFFGFYFTTLIFAYSLAKFKISGAPSILTLITFPVFSFIPDFYNVVQFNTLLVIIPSCLVASLLIENAYDHYKAYNNNVMRTIITVIDFILPLSCFFYLIFLRDSIGLYSWEIFIAAFLLLITYVFTYSSILSQRFEEYNITNPRLVNLIFMAFLNALTFFTLLTEISRQSDTQILFSSLYVVLAVGFSMVPIIFNKNKAEFSDSSAFNFILPLTSYFLFIFKREELQILSWTVFLVSLFLYISFFIGLYSNQIFQESIQTEEIDHDKDSLSTKVLEAISILAINTGIIFALITEINNAEPNLAIYAGLYLALLIGSSMFTMNSRLEGGLSLLHRLILTLILLEIGFIILFVNSYISDVGIALDYNLAFLFLFGLMSLYLFRKTELTFISTASLLVLGCVNLFVNSLVTPITSISTSFASLFILGISICFGIVSLLHTLDKVSLDLEKETITISHLHSLSFFSLTAILWYIAQNTTLFFFFYAGVLISILLWLVNLFMKKKETSTISEELMGTFAIAISLISIPAQIHMLWPFVIFVALSLSVVLAGIPFIVKNYNIGVPLIIYLSLIISLFTFPGSTNPFGIYWILPIVYILPTLSILFVSTKHDDWRTRIGTTLLATITLILISLSLRGTSAEILIAISSGILIIFPILFFVFNMQFIDDETQRNNAIIEYPIDLLLVTFGAVLANAFIIPQEQLLDLVRESLVFVIILTGAVIGPIIYLIHLALGKVHGTNIDFKTKLFLSVGFVSLMHFLFVFTGIFGLLRAEFLIGLLIPISLVTLVYFYYHQFDTLLLIPAFISTLVTPALFVLENIPGRPSIEEILANPILIHPVSIICTAILFVYLLSLSINWVESRNENVTVACFSLASLNFIVASFIPSLNPFRILPAFIPFIVFASWVVSTGYTAWKARMKLPDILYHTSIWNFTASLLIMSLGWLVRENFTFTSSPSFLSYSLSIISTFFLLGLFSSITQYKYKPEPKEAISHSVSIQLLFISIGSLSFFLIEVAISIQLTLFYIFFSIFTIISYTIIDSLVLEYVLVKTDVVNAELAHVLLFVPFYLHSFVVVLMQQSWYGFVPFVLALLFYGISYKSQMRSSSLTAMIAIALSTFYLAPADRLLTYTSFIFVSSVMAVILILSYLLYRKTENEFHFVPALLISLITIAISGFLSPMAFELSFGLAFTLALVGVFFSTNLEIQTVQIISSITSGVIGVIYIIFIFVNVGSVGFQYGSLLFLFAGILLIVFSYVAYLKKKEKTEKIENDGEIEV